MAHLLPGARNAHKTRHKEGTGAHLLPAACNTQKLPATPGPEGAKAEEDETQNRIGSASSKLPFNRCSGMAGGHSFRTHTAIAKTCARIKRAEATETCVLFSSALASWSKNRVVSQATPKTAWQKSPYPGACKTGRNAQDQALGGGIGPPPTWSA